MLLYSIIKNVLDVGRDTFGFCQHLGPSPPLWTLNKISCYIQGEYKGVTLHDRRVMSYPQIFFFNGPRCLQKPKIAMPTSWQGCGSVFIFYGSGSRAWCWRPIRIQIRIWIQYGSRALITKNWKKITAENLILFFFWSKTAIFLSLSLHKVCPSYRRSLQFSKEAIQHFKTWTFTNYCLLLWVIFAILDPDPDSEYESGSGSTDPIEYGSGSGSESSTLHLGHFIIKFYSNIQHFVQKGDNITRYDGTQKKFEPLTKS